MGQQGLAEVLTLLSEQLYEVLVQRIDLQMKIDALVHACKKTQPQVYEAYLRDLQQTMRLTDVVAQQIRQTFEPLIQCLKNGAF